MFIGCTYKKTPEDEFIEEYKKGMAQAEKETELLLSKIEKDIEKDPKYFKKSNQKDDEQTRKKSLFYQNIAKEHIDKGEYTKALKALEKMNPVIVLMEDNKINANFYNNLSLLYYRLKQYQKAYYFQKKSSSLFSKIILESLINMTFDEKKKFLEDRRYNMHNLILMAFSYQTSLKKYSEKKKIIDETFKSWLVSKGELSNVESYLMELRNETKNNKKLKLKIEEYLKATRVYSSLYLKKLYSSKKFTLKNEQELKQIEKKRWKLEKYITPYINDRSLWRGGVSMHDADILELSVISENINKNELYIDFIRTDKDYYLFTINSKKQLTFNKLNSNGENIDKLTKSFRAEIKNKKNIKDIGNKLYKLLFTKVVNLKKYTKLIISPDGVLNLLPFEALWTNSKKYLIEEKNIVYVTSGKSLFKSRERDRYAYSHREIVSLSYLDYTYKNKKNIIVDTDETTDKKITEIFHRRRGLKLLKHTKDEDAFMRKLFPKYKFISYIEKNATKDMLYSIKSPQILHISTHSFYGEDDKKKIDPLLKSTLALSEFNAIIKDYNPKGVLSALEFSTLNLYNTELVFFSSCQSGLGDMHTSEGLSGLNRGAKIAGAKRVISTLWSVDEKESLRLTKKFYTHLVKHSSPHFLGNKYRDRFRYSSALRATKLAMIKQHPFYWAGFVQYGLDSYSNKKVKQFYRESIGKVVDKAVEDTVDKAVDSLFEKLF